MKKKILIVDDNSNDRYLLEVLLKGYGYNVTSAENGEDALLLARKEPPDAIISDIMMPVMDGFSLCREWKLDEKLKTIPFIFYTSTYTNHKDEKFAMNLGAEMFIIKPQEPKALVQKLCQVFEKNDGKKSVVFEFPLGKEMEFFRDYNKLLFQKLEKKMAELQNEKEFLKNIFESLTHPFYVIDTSDQVILMANSAACKNNLTAGSKCFELTHKRNIKCSGEAICPLEEVKKTNKPVTVEHVHFDKYGNPRNVEVHGYPIFDTEGKVVQMIEYSLDITEQKKLHDALKESEERLRTLFEKSPDAIFLADPETGIIIDANSKASELIARPHEEIIGMHQSQLHPARNEEYSKESFKEHAGKTNQQKDIRSFENIVLRPDGTEVPVEVLGHIVTIKGRQILMGVFRDITERKTAEILLLESRKRYQALFEQAGDGIVMHDINGKIMSVNETFAHMHGLSVEEIIQKGLDRLDVEGMKKVPGRMPRIIDGETLSFEVEHYHKDGHIFPLLVTANLISTGNERFIISIHRDLTERKRAENSLKENEKLLNYAQKLAHIGHFKYNPFTGVVEGSDELFRIFGLTREQFQISYFVNSVHPDDRAFYVSTIESAIKQEKGYEIEHRLMLRDGTIKWVRAICEFVTNLPKEKSLLIGIVQDITKRKQRESQQNLSKEILTILNKSVDLSEAINSILTAIQRETGLEAVGIRLRSGQDYPYFAQKGFSDDFLLTENTLTVRDQEGGICRDKNGKASLECTCGLVLSGKTDPVVPLFTAGGSAWTNNSMSLLNLPADEDPRLHLRNRCIHEGFCSVALIPVRELKERTEKTQNLLDILKTNSIYFGIISFFLALIMGYSLSHRISEPIVKLKNASYEISKGNLDIKIEINTEDEIEGLSNTFNEMTQNLKNSRNETTIANTEQKRLNEKITKSLEEKEVLLREIHHRVKNNMQIITSLLNLQSQNIEDKKYKDIFIDSQNRIQAMALIHEKLYQSESIAQINFKDYIEEIVSNIFESYSIKSNIKIDINIENIPIKIDYAVPCGLIINELVTNSLKYAFPDGRQGKIQISLKSNDNNMVQLSISDDGIGIVKDMDIRNTKSLGLHLVTALAESQLHGQVILNREKGTEFQINFRLAK